MDKYIGRLLDNRYEILEVIGTGGMAVVYKARCHRLNRLVAIKILKDDYLEDEEFRRRFHSESQAVAMLSHPNIVSIYDVSSYATADYIVMELIDGITLKQYMEKKGVLNWKETLHFAIQIAKALEHAHSKGIVHRDIKPHNVMVLKNGSVKVTDFGIARMMSKGNTLTKEALGSVHYISPEQAKGGRVDNRSDIYSLGVVMYEMMSGRPPYDGESPVAVAIQHINGGAAMPSTLNPNIPGGLEQIIMRAMAHETSERYTSATQMLGDMDEFRKDPGILFDYNIPPLDEVITLNKPPLVLTAEPPQSTAEKVERRKTEEPAPPPPRHRTNAPAGRSRSNSGRQPVRSSADREEEQRSNVATIAIIACSAVMVIAIVIFLVVLFSDGTGSKVQLVDVPNLIGMEYDTLPNYKDFDVKIGKEVYNDTYPDGQIIEQNPVFPEKIGKGESIYVVVSMGKAPNIVKMPNITQEWTVSDAERALNNLGLNLQIKIEEENHDEVLNGYVIRTEPMAETELTAGQKVKLFVSMGMEMKVGAMPDVVGDKLDSAKKVLEAQELNLQIIEEVVFDSFIPQGDVVRTEPAVGEELTTGQTVTLYISQGPKYAEITKGLIGLPVESVEQMLNNKGFLCQISPVESDKKAGTVLELRNGDVVLNEGDKVDVMATTITIVVSMGPNGGSEITKDVVIDLRGSADNGDCQIRVLRNDQVVFEQIVTMGTTTITIPNQTASGAQKYKVVIDDLDGFDHWEEFS